MSQSLTPAAVRDVQFYAGFLGTRVSINREVTLPIEYRHCRDSGRLDAPRWKAGKPNPPHPFWDSDVAKWIEAAAYSLATDPDPDLEAQVDRTVETLAQAQQPDGYLNSYFTRVAPQKRWTNLRDRHELYCAGHLMEAATAYFKATGKKRFLNMMCRYADLICTTFGPARNQLHGYPGHEEIELALVKLYRTTGVKRYLDMAAYFVNQRGTQPHAFDEEARKRGDDPETYAHRAYDYCQAHLPVREQATAEGHSVRACYLYAGMADVARETRDDSLLEACRRIWRNIVERRMYITGGVGSTQQGERFTVDYDLPNETAYAETCAAIALVFFAHRMLRMEPTRQIADVMERTLYNGVLAGVSADGARFFYANPLARYPAAQQFGISRFPPERQEWFGCACCPPNIARLIASLGAYLYSAAPGQAWVHLYSTSEAHLDLGNTSTVTLHVETDYPWDERVAMKLSMRRTMTFMLALRLPGWCEQPTIRINGENLDLSRITVNGYAHITRMWEDGDRVDLEIPMPVRRIKAHPGVRHAAGCVALQRGPIVYCLEEEDNGPDLAAITLPAESALVVTTDGTPFAGIPVIRADALRHDPASWQHGGLLYRPREQCPAPIQADLLAIPYALWANRTLGEMRLWIPEC